MVVKSSAEVEYKAMNAATYKLIRIKQLHDLKFRDNKATLHIA